MKDITGKENVERRDVLWVSQGQTCSCWSQEDAPLNDLLKLFSWKNTSYCKFQSQEESRVTSGGRRETHLAKELEWWGGI
jgi:hypothetical protein